MHFSSLAIVATSFAVFSDVTANDIELNTIDIPNICRPSCQPVQDLIIICRVQNGRIKYGDRNHLERQCYCRNRSFNVLTRTHDCGGCMRFENPKRGRGSSKDIDYILRVCGFNKGKRPGIFADTSATNGTFVPTETQPVAVQAVEPELAQLTAQSLVEPEILPGLKEGDVPVALESNAGPQMPVDGQIQPNGTTGNTDVAPIPVDETNVQNPPTVQAPGTTGAAAGFAPGGVWCSTALLAGLTIFVGYL